MQLQGVVDPNKPAKNVYISQKAVSITISFADYTPTAEDLDNIRALFMPKAKLVLVEKHDPLVYIPSKFKDVLI